MAVPIMVRGTISGSSVFLFFLNKFCFIAGVIDEDYRGNVGVVLFNFNKKSFEVKKGDRIAQLICEQIYYPELEEHETLDETDRGAGGFGSTGSN
nr:PREDICTED: deoxyuridine 5'-triphosphate nucleotidohydrolase, mitochondrial [Latimeria chalumnae]|eukprot:XP_014345313.1 PREDICTED: deoxyuridine 5'-triphosphate nucleotidohydrolase, mitochondrial [Latimeria chalumnae]